MLNKLTFVLITLLITTTVLADSYSTEEKNINFVITPSVAYRYDVFKYAIADNMFTNKKISELIWKNRIIQPSIKFEIEPKPNQFIFLGQVRYGYILKNPSKSWDLDWDHDYQRSELGSKSLSSVRGSILDLSGAVGYSVNLFNNNLLTFYLGYDYTDYRNKNYGYSQLVYKRESLPLTQLFQKYYFKTQAPWIGLSLNTPLNEKFTIIPIIKFYSFKHIGKGYWLFRGDLKQNPSLRNIAKGIGLGFDVDFVCKYSDNLDLKLNLETKRFKMKKGKQQMFYNADAFSGERVATIKLLDLSYMSSSISAGFKYKL